jgi:hypothetical protein
MRKQDYIIALIKSLSVAEKRSFLQIAKAETEDKEYLKLYEELLTVERYDASALSKKLGKKKASLANEKKYLEKVLMKALREMKADQAHLKPINSLLDSVVLIDRGLYELASNALKKTIEQSQKMSLPNIEWYAHGLMLTVSSEPNVATTEMQDVATKHLEGMNNCAQKMTLTSSMEQLSFAVYDAYDRRHYDLTEKDKEETRTLIQNPLLVQNHNDSEMQFQRFNLLTLLHSRLRDFETTVGITSNWMALLEEQPHIEPNEYSTALSCHAQALISRGDSVSITACLDRLQSKWYLELPVNTVRMDELLKRYLYWHISGAHYFLVRNGKSRKGQSEEFLDKYISEWPVVNQSLTANHLITATFQIACCGLLLGKPEECNWLLNRLFMEIDSEVHPYRWGQAKILFAMSLISQGDFKLFPSAVKNSIYYLKKRKLYNPIEKTVLGHFNSLQLAPTKMETIKWLEQFKGKMEPISKNTLNASTTEHLPYMLWVQNTLESHQTK